MPPETIDLTALFRECQEKGGFEIKSFESIFRNSGCRISVIYRNTELQIIADFKDGFEGLQKAVGDKYETHIQEQILASKSSVEFYNRELKRFREARRNYEKKVNS